MEGILAFHVDDVALSLLLEGGEVVRLQLRPGGPPREEPPLHYLKRVIVGEGERGEDGGVQGGEWSGEEGVAEEGRALVEGIREMGRAMERTVRREQEVDEERLRLVSLLHSMARSGPMDGLGDGDKMPWIVRSNLGVTVGASMTWTVTVVIDAPDRSVALALAGRPLLCQWSSMSERGDRPMSMSQSSSVSVILPQPDYVQLTSEERDRKTSGGLWRWTLSLPFPAPPAPLSAYTLTLVVVLSFTDPVEGTEGLPRPHPHTHPRPDLHWGSPLPPFPPATVLPLHHRTFPLSDVISILLAAGQCPSPSPCHPFPSANTLNRSRGFTVTVPVIDGNPETATVSILRHLVSRTSSRGYSSSSSSSAAGGSPSLGPNLTPLFLLPHPTSATPSLGPFLTCREVTGVTPNRGALPPHPAHTSLTLFSIDTNDVYVTPSLHGHLADLWLTSLAACASGGPTPHPVESDNPSQKEEYLHDTSLLLSLPQTERHAMQRLNGLITTLTYWLDVQREVGHDGNPAVSHFVGSGAFHALMDIYRGLRGGST
eukprot:gene3103-3815_t